MAVKKNITRRGALALAAAAALAGAGCSQGAADSGNDAQASDSVAFKPSQDTEAKVTLDVVGYFGNFEALDQVMADFNAHYPNLDFTYSQVGGTKESEYLAANPQVDIFMTSCETMGAKGSILPSLAVDLGDAGVDVSDLNDAMLKSSRVDGKLLSIPMGQSLTGIVVNEALLEAAGLEIPQTAEDFYACCSALKGKGYVPLQGPASKLFGDVTADMVFSIIGRDESLQKALADGDASGLQALAPAFDFLDELVGEGYVDAAANAEYPEDNYDKAILRFFDGEVPFWACNTEKVSGMKKRETKSEAFQASPFTYRFIKVPNGKKYGEYVYQDPWCGFAASNSSPNSAYAVDFIRFLATRDESNTMSGIKGVPSIAKDPVDPEIYQDVLASELTSGAYVNDGSVTPKTSSAWYSVATRYATGELGSREEALDALASWKEA